ncbi:MULTISPECIES: undecaprenyl-diphosphate phosphatase [Leptospira]|uniref:undecaprenyl-diphosphate phosphatase n=1 Tax=Leptospira TaxID=171 RepID=UPI0002BAE235|nr:MULTISPECIES: undecaprenyl-diphosphate phosphatase [Leptospira]MBM2889441.1 undecaprenyl-diphosphate phosphatase [Leptospira interrogans]QOI34187.1 undecaprenyl-diphosphate phosphatase [Leptospira interrogans serovar Icterohaemorrhagiae]UMQ59883.1 undecaprenyl-diphosphate phosphatase [Leptospira interrogans]UNE68807.1 undecaprenyl-diphosphate phosphatase [Leptospira interrogans]
MNPYLNAFLRSIIEAITEFLPVSSTGHLFLFSSFFPFYGENVEFDDLFDIFIQSGAILSVLFLYREKFKSQIVSSFRYILKQNSDSEGFYFLIQICIGAFPILIAGFIAKKFLDTIKARPDLLEILSGAWIFGGVLILVAEWYFHQRPEEKKSIGFKDSILIGIFQCMALIPGMSRSAATIITARFLGKDTKSSAEFSFFLAVPVLLAAGIYKLIKYRSILNGNTIPVLMFGFLVSFLLCTLVIRWFLRYIQKHSFSVFGVYRILLGVGVLVLTKLI